MWNIPRVIFYSLDPDPNRAWLGPALHTKDRLNPPERVNRDEQRLDVPNKTFIQEPEQHYITKIRQWRHSCCLFKKRWFEINIPFLLRQIVHNIRQFFCKKDNYQQKNVYITMTSIMFSYPAPPGRCQDSGWSQSRGESTGPGNHHFSSAAQCGLESEGKMFLCS